MHEPTPSLNVPLLYYPPCGREPSLNMCCLSNFFVFPPLEDAGCSLKLFYFSACLCLRLFRSEKKSHELPHETVATVGRGCFGDTWRYKTRRWFAQAKRVVVVKEASIGRGRGRRSHRFGVDYSSTAHIIDPRFRSVKGVHCRSLRCSGR